MVQFIHHRAQHQIREVPIKLCELNLHKIQVLVSVETSDKIDIHSKVLSPWEFVSANVLEDRSSYTLIPIAGSWKS